MKNHENAFDQWKSNRKTFCTHFNDIFDSSPASDSCFVTAVFAAPLDALGALENVL